MKQTTRTHTAYTNVFDDGDGRRYPGGIIFKTAKAALKAQEKKNKGTAIFVAQITWKTSLR
jgi:hypothetical protein